jgi:hypothetical protein
LIADCPNTGRIIFIANRNSKIENRKLAERR